MNEMDKQLKEALAENGNFDPEKADALKKTIVADFGAKMRKIERYAWGYLTVCLIVIFFAVMAFQQTPSNDIRSLILFAIVFLVGFESTILFKIWSWIACTRATLLKETKLLRLAQPAQGKAGGLVVPDSPRQSCLSRWERIVWLVVLVVGPLFVVGGVLPAIGIYEAETSSSTYVTLEADGSGTAITKMKFRNISGMPMTSFQFDAPATSELSWLDEQGRKLTATAVSKDDRKHYTIELPAPLMPDDWFSYTRITKSPTMVQKEKDGLWVYRADVSYGTPRTGFMERMLLPEGTKDISLQVQGEMEHESQNGRRIFVNTYRDANDPFKFTVEYRLPSDEKNEKEEEVKSVGKEMKKESAAPSKADSEVMN